jgi:hypothetical protein
MEEELPAGTAAFLAELEFSAIDCQVKDVGMRTFPRLCSADDSHGDRDNEAHVR